MTTTRASHPIRHTERTNVVPLFRQQPPASTEDWHADFAIRAGAHTDVTTSGMWILAPVVHDGLRRSLPTFQLGEMGTGWHLTKMAARTGDLHYLEAIRYFVAEEQEHARLLALVCEALDIDMIQEHWTDAVFQRARRICGLRAEVLILLVAEVVSSRFYEILSTGVGDPTLARLFARIHADELRHLDFHAATLPAHLQQWSPAPRRFARTVWNATAIGAAAVVAWDHRKLLRACNSGPVRFFRDCTKRIRSTDARFFDPSDAG